MRACAKSISAASAMAEPLLDLEDVRAGYGDAVVLDGISLDTAGARKPGGARPQRRRQEHAAAHHHGLHVGAPRRHPLARRGHHVARAASPRPERARLGGAGARDLSLPDRARRTSPSRHGRAAGTSKPCTTCFPGCTSAAAISATSSPAASSRCWRLRARSPPIRSLLMLDEPLEGLAPIIVEELTGTIRRMAVDEGTALILVEQHADVALSLTDHALVLERGASCIAPRRPSSCATRPSWSATSACAFRRRRERTRHGRARPQRPS